MDMLQKLGGRKFLIALIGLGVGAYLELVHGLSVNMASLIVGLVGAFSVTNHLTTSKYFDQRANSSSDDSLKGMKQSLEEIKAIAISAKGNPDDVQQLVELLKSINANVGAVGESIKTVQDTTGQIGLGMVNIGKEVKAVHRAVGQPTF
jgi:hypothetical protein